MKVAQAGVQAEETMSNRRALLAGAVMLQILMIAPTSGAGIGQHCAGFVGGRCDPPLWCELAAGRCHGNDISFVTSPGSKVDESNLKASANVHSSLTCQLTSIPG